MQALSVSGPLWVICSMALFTDKNMEAQKRQGTRLRPHSPVHCDTGCPGTGRSERLVLDVGWWVSFKVKIAFIGSVHRKMQPLPHFRRT